MLYHVGWSGHLTAVQEVEERVELYIYSPSGPSWPVLGRTLLASRNRARSVNEALKRSWT